MRFTQFVVAFVLPCLAFAQQYTIPPPTTAPADTILDCTNWQVGASGDTCALLADTNGITLQQLYRYVSQAHPRERVSLIDVNRTHRLYRTAIFNRGYLIAWKRTSQFLLLRPQPAPQLLQLAFLLQLQCSLQDLSPVAINFTSSLLAPLAVNY